MVLGPNLTDFVPRTCVWACICLRAISTDSNEAGMKQDHTHRHGGESIIELGEEIPSGHERRLGYSAPKSWLFPLSPPTALDLPASRFMTAGSKRTNVAFNRNFPPFCAFSYKCFVGENETSGAISHPTHKAHCLCLSEVFRSLLAACESCSLWRCACSLSTW